MKRGFTLIELLVYMAIMGFIIVVAGRVFSDSTDMRIRSQNLLKSSAEIGKLANLISEDISQMGAKAWGRTTSEGYKVVVHPDVYWDLAPDNPDNAKKDYSSYKLIGRPLSRTEAVFHDSLVFKKAVFDADGKFIAVRQIAWYAKEDSLFRKCLEVSKACPSNAAAEFCGGKDDDCTYDLGDDINAAPKVLIATNISNFKLTPSTPTKQDTLFPPSGNENFSLYSRTTGTAIHIALSNNHSTRTDVSNFKINDNTSTQDKSELYLARYKDPPDTWTDCEKLNFRENEVYVVEFKMPLDLEEHGKSSTQFIPGRDHLAIGLRKNDGSKIDDAPRDVLFYPPQYTSDEMGEIARHIEFSVKKEIKDACLAITFAFYSPLAGYGTFMFRDFKVFNKTDESFRFLESGDDDYNDIYGVEPDGDIATSEEKIKEKKSVKAFELILEMAIGKEDDPKRRKSGTFSQKGRGIIISTPNNGVKVE
jgi:prepilin-type N-terminal cleavage/methylation domain-containing protein